MGPDAATIAVLLDANWIPVFPNRWLAPDRDNYHTLTNSTTDFQEFTLCFGNCFSSNSGTTTSNRTTPTSMTSVSCRTSPTYLRLKQPTDASSRKGSPTRREPSLRSSSTDPGQPNARPTLLGPTPNALDAAAQSKTLNTATGNAPPTLTCPPLSKRINANSALPPKPSGKKRGPGPSSPRIGAPPASPPQLRPSTCQPTGTRSRGTPTRSTDPMAVADPRPPSPHSEGQARVWRPSAGSTTDLSRPLASRRYLASKPFPARKRGD